MNHPYRGEGVATAEAQEAYSRLSDDGKFVLRNLLSIGRIDRDSWLAAMYFICDEAQIPFSEVQHLKAHLWDHELDVEKHLADVKRRKRVQLVWAALGALSAGLSDDEWAAILTDISEARKNAF